LRSRKDGFIRSGDRILSHIRQGRVTFGTAVSQEAKDLVHRDRAGNFTRCSTAHAVANNVNTCLDGEAVGILV
jgi:hypothetical protein